MVLHEYGLFSAEVHLSRGTAATWEGTKQGIEFGRKVSCLGSRKVRIYSGNTCPGGQVLPDSGKSVFLLGSCKFVLKKHFWDSCKIR